MEPLTSEQGQFVAHYESYQQGKIYHLQFEDTATESQLSWHQVLSLWQNNEEFRAVFSTALAQVPYAAFFWETPPLKPGKFDRPFECVLIDNQQLVNVPPQPEAFAEYIGREKGSNAIQTFPNLSGDALLVVPCQNAQPQHYNHIASFLRSAPEPQIHALWQTLGQQVKETLANSEFPNLWVSTSGLGVYWLHIRLDSRPKYYQYQPYKQL